MKELAAQFTLLLTVALGASVALAHGDAPDVLLRTVTAEVTDLLKQELESRPADPARIAALVESRILPLVDFGHMTQLAMARNWRLATPEQQKVLAEEFKTLLVRTYSPKLAQYRGETIDVKRMPAALLDADATVRSEVNQPGKARMALEYEMQETGGQWKIYDVKIGGECLVNTYRDIFAEKVRSGGVDGLIKYLADGNREGTSKLAAVTSSLQAKTWALYAIIQNIFRGGQQ